MLNDYNVEIDEIDQHHVTLVIRALRLIVLGRTSAEAEQLARAAIISRSQEDVRQRAQTADGHGDDGAMAASTGSPEAARAA